MPNWYKLRVFRPPPDVAAFAAAVALDALADVQRPKLSSHCHFLHREHAICLESWQGTTGRDDVLAVWSRPMKPSSCDLKPEAGKPNYSGREQQTGNTRPTLGIFSFATAQREWTSTHAVLPSCCYGDRCTNGRVYTDREIDP